MAREPTVVLDCRWLGIGGPGRTTELVLRGLAQEPPAGRWVLWGAGDRTAALAWPGAEVRATPADPRRLLGQAQAFALPPGDYHVFMHQQRPLRSLPAATVIYDTIPLRHGTRPAVRALKRAFLRRVARMSDPILTISEHSKACIVRDLGVPADRLEIIRFPFDGAFADRVLALREHLPQEDAALFVGNFLPHKNLSRLLEAFEHTDFCRDGGRLVLVAGAADEVAAFRAGLGARRRGFVTAEYPSGQAELERLYATSLFLVQPSLEEGFGLPAWEAMCCGLPVCVSDGGALPEFTAGFADPFPASSVPHMAAALDECARRARGRDARAARAQSDRLRATAPRLADLGAQVKTVVEKHVGPTSTTRR